MNLDAKTFADLAAEPAPAETLSAVVGCPLVIVEVPDAAAAAWLTGLHGTALPAVVVLIVPDPGCLPPQAAEVGDVILTDDSAAPAPFVTSPHGAAQAAGLIGAMLAEHPVAGTTLAMLLRTSAALPVPAAVVAESAAYSTLQAGTEFLAWRDAHPRRPLDPADADGERVLTGRARTTLRVTLNRPAKRNAVDFRMRDALTAALAAAVAEPAVRVELRGNGPDFCTGGDLDEFGSRPDPAQAHLIRLSRSPALLLHRLADRTTAFLHGSCLGAGIELPAFASRIIAAPGTRIGLPEIRLGLLPGAGGTASLTRRIGRWRTTFLALTGETVDAETALSWGLVDAIASSAETP
jgi:enoyl-CoA hydratase/carnithine racemase